MKIGNVLKVVFFLLLFPSIVYASTWASKDNWKIIYFSSEQTVDYDERAINAIDNNPNTHWFSEWKPNPKPYPQELQVDIKNISTIDGFLYLPRQNTSKNGRVKEYQVYVSNDRDNWGSPVAEGIFIDNTDEKKIDTISKQGRYFRFVVLSDHSGSTTYAQAAEIGVRITDTVQEFPYGVGLYVTFDPSPDERATGHNFYITNTVSQAVTKIDLKKEIVYLISAGVLLQDIVYKFTATAYGTVNNKLEESVHSDPLFIKMIKREVPLNPPKNIIIIN